MAWITKNSARMEIERRVEPYLHDKLRKKMEKEILPRYATKQAALLPVCHEIMHENGYLPAQALEEVAEFLELTPAEVYDTVTFYEEFALKPLGKYVVQLCRSIGCELCGFHDLSKKLQAKLDILPGETTDDGRITLQELECLGCCEMAPMCLINGAAHGPLTWEMLEALIDDLPE